MKHFILLMTSILFTICLWGQSEKEANIRIGGEFEEYYNSGEYEQLFQLFSEDMKEYLPIDKTKEFLTGLKLQAGNIIERVFEFYENGTYASYKTTFDKAVFSLNISLDGQAKINGLFVKPYVDRSHTVIERNTTPLILPFKGEWTVFWGGDTKELNYHVEHKAQKGAFDLVITDESGKSYRGSGEKNKDYYAFGKELIAPCDGEVVLVVDGVKDNVPGKLNPIYVPGNTVIIKTKNDEYLFFAHFKQHSIVVEQGQEVKQGDLLGLCGNSGNSSEAHLHFHIQNVEDMTEATGAKCFFESIKVDGTSKTDYSPIKGEKISN